MDTIPTSPKEEDRGAGRDKREARGAMNAESSCGEKIQGGPKTGEEDRNPTEVDEKRVDKNGSSNEIGRGEV